LQGADASGQNIEANYIFNSSGAVSLGVEESYMDQAFG